MRLNVLLTLCWLVGVTPLVRAQQIVDVLPLTDQILMVHLDEGYVNHHQRGQKRGDETVTLTPLNIPLATSPATYGLSSADDASYSTPKQPTSIGRKSKGTDFAFLCQNYGATGCINTDADHAKEHWLYLMLPTPLQRGKSYSLSTGAVGSNGSAWPFTYNEKTIRSEAVHVNQIGYKPNAALKYGYVYHWLGDKGGLDLNSYAGKDFWVVNTATNQVAFTGKLTLARTKTNAETGQTTDSPNANFASADVYECNFSGLTTPGSYVLAVEGIGRSFPFVINQNVYAEVFGSVMNGLFKNRSGITLTVGELSDQNRPAPHNPNLTPGFKLYYSTARDYDYKTDGGTSQERAATKAAFEAGKKGLINTYGWYQDAGDWDGYFSHTRVPVNLLFLYESFPDKFTDNALKLTERGNGQPDVLDEARWLLRYFHRTRHAILDNGWGTGGVGGARATGDFWGGDERPDGTTKASWDDTDRDWYVSGEDVWTTYRYAGMAAHYAYCLQRAGVTDVESINWQQEAIDAYAWAKSKQTAADETPKGDYVLKNDRLYATAALYRLTGDAQYHNQFKTDFGTLTLSGVDFGGDGRFGLWLYANLPDSRTPDASIVSAIRARAESAANDNLVGSAQRRAARWGGNFFFPMLIGQGTSPMVYEGIVGYTVLKNTNATKANEYLSYIATTADYFLGNNPLNQTWVTGLGERYPREIFHMDSWYSGSGTTRTGIVPYGQWRTSNPRPAQIGWWDSHWPEKTLYPANMDTWPGHERWFDQRPTPLSAEFTIHQSQLWSITAYGTLFAAEEPPFQNVAVTGVSITPQSLTVSLGGTAKATATVQPGNATNPGVSWASSNTAVATVAADGTVTGVTEGTATVTVKTVDGNFTQNVAVTVQRIAVTNLTTSPQSLTVKVGRTAIITATVAPANASNAAVTWTSSNPPIATVTSGTVTGVAEGTAVITARTADGGIERQTTVTVGAISVFTCPGNVGVNGDLEAATLGTGASAANSGFQAFPAAQAQLVDDAASGVQAVRLGISADGYMHQILFNAPVKRYTLKVKVKRTGAANYGGFKLGFQNATGQDLPVAGNEKNITNASYEELTIGPLVAPAGTDKILCSFYVGAGGSLYIDDFCLTTQDIADTEAPAPPTGLKADNVSSQNAQLSWTAATDNVAVTNYEVYNGSTKVGETASPTFSVTGLSPGTGYTFTVKAVDAAGNVSGASNSLSVTTPASDPRYVLNPTDDKDNDGNGTRTTVNHSQFTNAYYKFNLSGVSGTPTRAILRLNKTAGNAYLTYLGVHPDSQDGWTETGTTNPGSATVISTRSLPTGTGSLIEFDVTEYVKTELGRNKIASFQLNTNVSGWLSVGTKENTGAKPELVITTAAFSDTQAPTAPGSLTTSEVAAGGFRLSWTIATDNVGVTGYEVYNGATKLATLGSDAYTYLVKGLTPATAYNLTVKAIDGAGNGTASAPLAVTTAPTSATALTMAPTDDAGNPDNALGTSPSLTLSQFNTTFLRFDLGNVQAPVSTARLRLYSGSALTVVLKASSTKTWSETNQSALPTATGAELKTADATANAYVEIDVTDLVQASLTGDKLLSWALNHRANDWRSLRSKEASDNRPQLVLTLAPETAPAAPTFSGLPQSGTACAGQALTLTATCTSGTVNWQGTPQGTVNGGLIVLPTTAGMYSYSAVCRGTTLGSSVATASLNVRPATAIATQPLAATSLCAGANVSVSVAATGENLTYQWQKGGTNLDGATAAMLSLTGVQSAQAGSYRLMVTGTCGAVTSDAFVLTVNSPLAPNYASISGQAYASGQSSVTVAQGSGNVTFAADNCTGQLTWNGPNNASGTGHIVASISAAGTFVYTGTCTLGGCLSTPASVTVTVTPPTLKVQYADGDGGLTANNQAKPNLRLVNEGTTAVPLSELTVRYWFTAENFADINTWIDYAQVGNVRMKYVRTEQPHAGADGYVEYSFTSGAGSLAPNGNSGPIQSRFANKDWANLDETDDYSFRAGSAYANTDRITLYRTTNDGAPQLIWGTEPAIAPTLVSLKVLMENKNASTTSNTISTFLKLDNTGNVPVRYEDVVVRYWFTSDGTAALAHTIDYAKLGTANVTGKFVRLNPTRTKADAYFDLAFKPALGSLYPRSSTGNIQYRLNKTDWSNFTETNDHSYMVAAPFAENTRVTVYHKGELIYGTEPVAASGGREAAHEPSDTWQVTVFDNPTADRNLRFQVSGATGQTLHLQLTDVQGRVVTEQQIDEAGAVEQRSLSTSGRTGVLLLRVSTQHKAVTVRVLAL